MSFLSNPECQTLGADPQTQEGSRPSRTVRLRALSMLSYGDTPFKYMVPSYRDIDTRLTFNCRRSSLAKMSKRDSSKIAAPQSTPLRLGCRNSPKSLRHKQRRFPSRSPSPVTWLFSHRKDFHNVIFHTI